MPTPQPDESRDGWIERCMSSDEAQADFPDSDQRLAFCNSRWEEQAEMQAVHRQITARPERATLMGFEGWRVPTTALREQVLSNNVGEMFVGAEEIAASADRWNMTPITLGHPRERGVPKSGREEDVLNERAVGFLVNATEQDGELKADAFFPDRMLAQHEAEDAIIGSVQSGDPVPVSTGFGGHFDDSVSGSHEGQTFNVRARSIEPDHFAILLDGEGACSTEDGCGLGMNEDGESDMDEDAENVAETVLNRLKNWFTTEYEPPTNGEETMDEETLDALAENTGLDRDRLEAMEDEELETMDENILSEDGEEEPAANGEDEPEGDEPPEWAENLVRRIDELEEAAEPAVNEMEQKKNRLVSEAAQNSRFSEDELDSWSIEDLEKLRDSTKAGNYAGRGGPKADNENAASPGTVVQAEHTPYWAENENDEEG